MGYSIDQDAYRRADDKSLVGISTILSLVDGDLRTDLLHRYPLKGYL
jgi:hypothetical protein